MAQGIYYGTHMAANGTATPVGSVLGTVTVNTKGGGGNTVTCYDGANASGVVIAVIDTTVAQGTYLYDILTLSRSIFISMSGGTPADITVGTY